MVENGVLYKRYNYKAKPGKVPPVGYRPCEAEADPETGSFPGWVAVDYTNPADRYFVEAIQNQPDLTDGTYELVGPNVQGNPYGYSRSTLLPHGAKVIEDFPRDFEGIQEYLTENEIEGVVFWQSNDTDCEKYKIRKKDFGLAWNQKPKEKTLATI